MMTPEDLFQFKINLFEAYYDCRRNKRNTTNALAFEVDFEKGIESLYHEILDRSYRPGRSIVFIVYRPVIREIFAADFRDRVVHHFVINRINPIFERLFIYDSYSCRKNKGTLFGIHRVEKFLRSASANYTKDCYVLKLDILGFFMHIRRKTLSEKVRETVEKHYVGNDKSLLLFLLDLVILHDPTSDCIMKYTEEEKALVPPSKSLFNMPEGCGLPIGNLTSQIFANVYLNDFDHFVKRQLKAKYYGRYVDDFVLINSSKEVLLEQREQIRCYLKETLGLDVHPKKEYLQHYTKGFSFLGAYIKPYRSYVGTRILKSFHAIVSSTKWISHYDFLTCNGGEKREEQIKSYLGLMKHFKTYKQIEHVKNKFIILPMLLFLLLFLRSA